MSNLSAELRDEVEARIEAMAASGDIPEDEREATALDDIAELSAADHGAYTAAERAKWNRLRAEARRALAAKEQP